MNSYELLSRGELNNKCSLCKNKYFNQIDTSYPVFNYRATSDNNPNQYIIICILCLKNETRSTMDKVWSPSVINNMDSFLESKSK